MIKNRPLTYVLSKREMSIEKLKGQIVQVASPTDRHCISFEHFCDIADNLITFNYMELISVLNLVADMERVASRTPKIKKPKKETPETGGSTSDNHLRDRHVGI